ncbi:MAG: hypothetical protein A3J68_02035 [Candidatus Wildermuthbacteria bacterium RIFCSPHIGHO2_02_FULL_48_16]|uniref:Glycosyltransferase RgtA/B/C/D-like domain-containing protein n=1 Tax=Candidatus Wildermuthbacteria bacterium RIFCSPHIGHO2_02_FULL_48_16 TaxID=1802453 RepID=A0A1G2R9V0_9BACT|nr:MAG: hypothetical protein A3J68_02035 [Candidatus Wildermuthbacteria bacterium RIFCSPHIGHO2_02_FULL_48_16]
MTYLIALMVLAFLALTTVFFLLKFGVRRKEVYALFLIVLVVYLASAAFIYATQFYPLGGGQGDQHLYHTAAVMISQDFHEGDFSLESIKYNLYLEYAPNWYPVLIAALYFVTVPDVIVGAMVNVWFAALSALLLYALVLHFGASRKWAFLIGLSPILYPSYLYWGSILLRESLVIVLALASVLLMLKLQKRFSLFSFFLFFCALGALIYFRFYIGFAVLFVFAFSWFFLFYLQWKKKLIYGLFVIPLLGFLPQISGHGYYGSVEILHYAKPSTIVTYREFTPGKNWHPDTRSEPVVPQPPSVSPGSAPAPAPEPVPVPPPAIPAYPGPRTRGLGSTVVLSAETDNPVAFVKNYLTSFSFMALGPFPWHIRYARQLFVLLETIPWWVVAFFLVKGVVRSRNRWRDMLPLLLVSLGILAEIALLLNTYGTYMRIRMPAFLLLFTLLPFAFSACGEISPLRGGQKDQKEVETA